MHYSLISLLLASSAEALRISSLSIKSAPYPIVDADGNSKDYNPERTLLWNSTVASTTNPASITLETSDDKDLLTIDVEGEVPAGTTLRCRMGSSDVFAPVALKEQADGRVQTVTTSMSDDKTVMTYPWAVKGKVQWYTSNAVAVEDADTPVEIYAVSNTLPDYFQKYGIYRDLVDFLLPPNAGKNAPRNLVNGRVSQPWDTESYNRYATEKIHFDSKFQYDTFSGAAWYANMDSAMFDAKKKGKPQGTFRLRSWLNHRQLISDAAASPFHVNCYDQASLVQICQSLGPTPMSSLRVAFMQPFGYIKETSLVGYSDIKTNSPFFGDDRAKADLPARDGNRTFFGNHLFCTEGGGADDTSDVEKAKMKIHDACAGPAVGDKSFAEYLNATIDPNNDDNMVVPALSTAVVGPGIHDFDVYTVRQVAEDDSDDAPEQENQEAFESRLKTLGADKVSDAEGKVHSIDFGQLSAYMQNKGPAEDYYKILHSETTMSGSGKKNSLAMFDWIYRLNNEPKNDVKIRLMVAKDYKGAVAAMNHSLAQMDNSFEKVFQAQTDESKKLGSWTLMSKQGVGRGRVMFIEGNVVCDVTGMGSSEALHETAEAVHSFITNPPADAAHPGLPEIGTIVPADDHDGDASKISIRKGQRLSFTANVKNAYECDWKIKQGNAFVTYMKQDGDRFDIDVMGMKEGQDELTFSFLNSAGEMVSAKPIPVYVVKGESAPPPAKTAGTVKETSKEEEKPQQAGQEQGAQQASGGQQVPKQGFEGQQASGGQQAPTQQGSSQQGSSQQGSSQQGSPQQAPTQQGSSQQGSGRQGQQGSGQQGSGQQGSGKQGSGQQKPPQGCRAQYRRK